MYRIGIDFGGTFIAAGLVDGAMRIVDRASVRTNVPRPIEGMIGDMDSMVRELLERNGLRREQAASVGVGVPGTANVENGHIEDANNLGFDDEPFVPLLEEQLGLPVRFGNDANAAAWGEYRTGNYPEDSFVMMTLGTGIGGGIILNGKLWSGINGAAAEFGHMAIRCGGAPCSCGRSGCFEAYGSATALIRQARERMQADDGTLLWELCGGDLARVEAKTVFDGAEKGDAACVQLLDGYTTCLAEGAANIINLFQPAYLCVGGGVSRAGDALLLPLREKTAKRIYSQNAKRNTQIVLARLDNDAGIIGAALLE
ncbi:MAG: ROK family protein [Oscillospiraceae bacterium]|nr:ROK family protein [Oscillospiraceae bacterium]